MFRKNYEFYSVKKKKQKSKNYFSYTVVIAAKPCLVLSIQKVIQADDSIDQAWLVLDLSPSKQGSLSGLPPTNKGALLRISKYVLTVIKNISKKTSGKLYFCKKVIQFIEKIGRLRQVPMRHHYSALCLNRELLEKHKGPLENQTT